MHLYGSLANEVLADANGDRDLLRPLHPRAPEIGAQIAYAYRREWAVTPEDVLRRRTTLALRGIDAESIGLAELQAGLPPGVAPSAAW